ncbi:VWFA-related domain-containing protein [Granulicella rosea]|uniref:VWFA-related domain-containing protein n=1 Tax=Granulicella rosea TaxID=474952 RepID=A0A239JRM2_9BACT|nr:VWA domain-containing protein [Granulicella rosea]SNT08490.1 VWFA-related domain-containing protein [Granulicella rosea]
MRLSAVHVAAALLAVSLAPCLHAQEAPSPGGPPPASDAPNLQVEHQDDIQTIKTGTTLVNMYFSVRDKQGFITNLHKDDCDLYENKDLQTIKNFTQEKNLPLTIGILLDTSGSQQNVLPLEQESGATFLKEVLTPKDEAFLISFDINVDLLSDYTSSPRELKRAIDKAQINTGAGTGSMTGHGQARGTLLFDAVYLAAHDKLRQEAGRKILVLLTDGGDQGSQETLKTATEAAQKANAIIYVILIADRGFYGGMSIGYSGDRDMEKLATDTGGRVINVGNNGKKLEDAFAQIQDELRTQYLLSYTPTNLKLDGTFRTLNLSCGKGYKVQTRKGYYAIAGDDNQN